MKSVVKTCSAFSLVELMIVVAILGILAALIIPEFQGQTQRAKEAAAKDDLRILREAIERYIVDYGVPPGYGNNDITRVPAGPIFTVQLAQGNYLSAIPLNPFNNLDTVMVYKLLPFPTEATGTYGWLYHPDTRQIRLDWPGTDSKGISYFTY
jgi:general secretion pathway protein G